MIYAPFTWSSRTIVTIGWVFYTRIIILTSETCPIQFNTYWFSTGLLHIFVQSSIVSRVRENQGFSTQSDYGALWVNMFLINPQKVKKTENVKNKNAFRQEKYHFPALKLDFSKPTNQKSKFCNGSEAIKLHW